MTGTGIGFVGIGAMGSCMAARLAGKGFHLVVHDRDRAAARSLSGARVKVADTLGGLAGCDLLITMLPDGKAVRDCVLGGGAGPALADLLAPGAIVLDMSSSAPAGTAELARLLARRGIGFLDAPVSGGTPRAQEGTLAIMVGGGEADLARCRPVLEAMGSRILHVGGVGAGHAVKALNNMLSAAGLAVAVEMLAVGKRFGLEPASVLEVLNSSTGRNNSTENKIAQQVFSRAFAAGFSMRLMVKDLETAMELAQQTRTPAPVSAACLDLWTAAFRELGDAGNADHTAIARYIEDRAGVVLE